MGINDWDGEKTEQSGSYCQGRRNSGGFDKVKSIVADRIHNVAEALREKAAEKDAQTGVAHYRNQASELLEQSADYVRQFDYKQADTRVREYVKQSPERSLLIAGAVGLIIGAVWRRR